MDRELVYKLRMWDFASKQRHLKADELGTRIEQDSSQMAGGS